MTMRTENDWIQAIRAAHANGLPNGWLLGWDPVRHFAGFTEVVKPHTPSNLTGFDYAFCNHFSVGLGAVQEGSSLLTVWLSFIAPAASMHWTEYEPGMKTGRVVSENADSEAERVAGRVERWIEEIGFELIPDSVQETKVSGIELELSDAADVTVGKCLFLDFDG